MHRLSFPEILSELESKLIRCNFERLGGEVFVGSETASFSPWISLAGNEFSFNPVLGVCNKNVDKLVCKALGKVVPNSNRSRIPVPLFRITPERISPGDSRIIRVRQDLAGYDNAEIVGFFEWLEEIGCPFLSQNSTFTATLDLALRWNAGDQAQQYYIPALFLLVERADAMDEYVRSVLNAFEPEAIEIALIYEQFIRELKVIAL